MRVKSIEIPIGGTVSIWTPAGKTLIPSDEGWIIRPLVVKGGQRTYTPNVSPWTTPVGKITVELPQTEIYSATEFQFEYLLIDKANELETKTL